MDINSLMSVQVAELQQTLQLSLLQKATGAGVEGTLEMLEELPQQLQAAHPYKGTVIDVQV
jgi:hypothetical protein